MLKYYDKYVLIRSTIYLFYLLDYDPTVINICLIPNN